MNSFLPRYLVLLGTITMGFSIATAAERVLAPGDSVNVESAKQTFKKITCGKNEAPACVVYSGSGGFQLYISDKRETHSSNFLKIARNVKAFQAQGVCGQIILTRSQPSPRELLLYSGQSLLLDYSKGIETATCVKANYIRPLERCYVATHPISAASLYYKDFRLATAARLLRDDYKDLEENYSKILSDIGLCSL
jgi:hypothetical protein